MRLFIALPLGEAVQKEITEIQGAFRKARIRGNYVPKENWHLTLAFLGETGKAEEVLQALQSLSFRPFVLSLEGVGHFDDLWWAGVHKSAELEAVVRQLRHLLSERHLPFEAGRFRAHITFLRRAVFQSDSLPPLSGKGSRMTVGEIVLYRSDRGKHGPVYTPLGSVQAEQTE